MVVVVVCGSGVQKRWRRHLRRNSKFVVTLRRLHHSKHYLAAAFFTLWKVMAK